MDAAKPPNLGELIEDQWRAGGKPTNAEAGAFIRRFCQLFSEHTGARYLPRRGKDGTLAKLLLSTYGAARLEKLVVEMLTCKDGWIETTDKGIGILTVKAAWLDLRVAQRERVEQMQREKERPVVVPTAEGVMAELLKKPMSALTRDELAQVRAWRAAR